MSMPTRNAQEIFLTAIDQYQPDQWPAFLREACESDDVLRGRVEELLQAHRDLGTFHEDAADAEIGLAQSEDQLGTVIGPYELLERIGEGGFGIVYLAEQSKPVRRRVALKLIKPGMDTRQVIARFEVEQQALAMMDHPSIAKVFDAGATDHGGPYFVMELVEGVPITDYCDCCQLTPRERLELFLSVCRAVEHAHQKGVIHRDIKPTNVLVAIQDGLPVPKIIDFGVAKAIGDRLTEQSQMTGFSQIIGTPLYMSPEQAELSPMGVDTRSDIYSLGVLLYELLTGATPFDKDQLNSASYDEMRRIICEEEPPLPSTRISTFSADLVSTIAKHRRTDTRRLLQSVRGEMDWIVMKCLEKDRSRRYEAASVLATDVQRFLANEPVLARPPSRLYLLGKFLRRNKRLVGSSVILLLMLVTIIGLTLFSYRSRMSRLATQLQLAEAQHERLEEERSRRDAEERARIAESERVNSHVDALIEEALRLGSGLAPDGVRAEALLTEALQYRPDDARLYLYRGSTRYEQGKNAEAIDDLQRSLELKPNETPSTHWLIALAATNLGDEATTRRHQLLGKQQDPSSIESLIVQALAVPFDERGIELLDQAIDRSPFDPLLYFYRGRAAYNLTARQTSQRWYDLAVADLEKALLARPRDIRICDILCRCYVHFHFLAAPGARPLQRVKWILNEWIAENPNDVQAQVILANWHLANGDFLQAVKTCADAAQLSPELFEISTLLGWSYCRQREFELAVASFSEALAKDQAEKMITEHVSVLAGRGYCYAALGQKHLARKDLDVALRAVPRNTWTIYEWFNLIGAYEKLGDEEISRKLSEEAVACYPACGVVYRMRGLQCAAKGNNQQAIDDMEQAIQLAPGDRKNYVAILNCLTKSRDYLEAERWSQKWIDLDPASHEAYRWQGLIHYKLGEYQDALSDFAAALSRDPKDARSHLYRGRTLYRLKRNKDALRALDNACELSPDNPEVYQLRADTLYGLKRYDLAVKSLTKALDLDSTHPRCFYLRGECSRQLYQFDSALSDIEHAIQLDDHNATYYDRRGLVRKALGQTELAIEDYRRALEINPQERFVNRHLIDALSLLGDSAGALNHCKTWQAEEPDSSDPWCVEGDLLRLMGDYQRALESLAEAVRRNKEDPVAYYYRGRVYAALGQPAKALDDFNQALEINPTYSVVFHNRGLANNHLQRYQEAANDFSRALEHDSTNPLIYYRRSESYRKLEQFEASLADIEEACRLDSQATIYFSQRGQILASQGRLVEALEQLHNALSLDPTIRFGRELIVSTYAAQGDLGSALNFTNSWVKEKPDTDSPYRYRGFVHFLAREYQAALADFEQATLRYPRDFRTSYHRGQTLIAILQDEQGRSELARSIQLCPKAKLATHYRNIGELFGEIESWQEATTHLSEGLRVSSRDVSAWHLLALVQLAAGEKQTFDRTTERLLELLGQTSDPTTARLIANTVALGEIHNHKDHLLALANQAVEGLPENAEARYTLGAVLFRIGRAGEAISHLSKAKKLMADRQSPAARAMLNAYLAMALHAAGEKTEASARLTQANNIDLDCPPHKFRGLSRLPRWSRFLAARLVRNEANRRLAESEIQTDSEEPLGSESSSQNSVVP